MFRVTKYSRKRGLKRLLQLAKLLDRVLPHTFHMRAWGFRVNPEAQCATTACAGGWATTLWPDELCLIPFEDGYLMNTANIMHIPTGTIGQAALEEFFGLTEEEALHLFGWDVWGVVNVTPQSKAAEIREFVRRAG